LLNQAVDIEAIEALAGGIKVVEESEAMDMGEENVGELGLFGGLDEGEEVLEHARGGTRGGHELRELVELLVGVEDGGHHVHLFLIEAQNAVVEGGRAHELDVLCASFELGNLLYYLIFGDVSFRKLLKVFFCKHNRGF